MSYMERLEEIKQKYSNLAQLWFGGQTVVNPDIEWLIRQAEKVQELEEVVYASEETYRQEREYNQRLKKENARLKKALRYIEEMGSIAIVKEVARRALKGESQ